jgi:ferredoxin
VFVREELCVGCGLCAKACPWGSVQMAPRKPDPGKRSPVLASAAPGAAPRHEPQSAAVAVKCDMCRDLDGGPACVNACPVDAIARVEPEAAMADVRKAVGGRAPRQGLPDQRVAWPWVAGAAVFAAAAARAPATTWGARLATGLLVGALFLALAGYMVVKRTRLVRGNGRSGVRPHTIAHLALGVAAMGVVAAHAGAKLPPNAAGALVVAFVLASLTGVAAALAYRLVPRALARVERHARLPEDLPGRARELDERAFGALTGRSDATKAVYGRLLAPYARAPLGWLLLVMRGATLRDEEKRLRGRVRRLLGPRAETLDGLDDMIRLVVERRAVAAQRVLQGTLRAWVPAHVVAVAAALVLLVVHVVIVARGR